ncbi:MAG: hypothetical protein J5716_09260 [Alphaproteobacteria bacterium]|nr:hypothetical protein [Alphaproteobacteria bacterium]
MKNIHTQESGRSMIEMLGVLAIIGVLSVGGIAGYSQAMSKFKVSKTTDQIQTMVQNIRTLFSSQKNYDGLSTTVAGGPKLLYAAGILTDENCPDSSACTTPMNPYGGTVKILYTSDDEGRSKRAFAVTYNGLPSDACVRLATQGWGDTASGLIAVQANNEETTPTADMAIPDEDLATEGATVSYTKTAHVPISFESATKGCGTGGSASSITLYYK